MAHLLPQEHLQRKKTLMLSSLSCGMRCSLPFLPSLADGNKYFAISVAFLPERRTIQMLARSAGINYGERYCMKHNEAHLGAGIFVAGEGLLCEPPAAAIAAQFPASPAGELGNPQFQLPAHLQQL